MGEEEVLQEGMAGEATQLQVAEDMAGMGRVAHTGALDFHLSSCGAWRQPCNPEVVVGCAV